MPFSSYALDKYMSQELSKFTTCDAPDLSAEFAEADYWLNNFILNSIFRVDVKGEHKPFIFAILRRAQMALAEYEAGRAEALNYIGGDRDRVSVYFKALYRFELVTQLLYQAYEYGSKLTDQSLFENGDGSSLQRLNRVYNVTKHLEPSSIPSGHIHAVWLSNQGVNVSDTVIDWNELAELVREVGSIADRVSNPSPPSEASDT